MKRSFSFVILLLIVGNNCLFSQSAKDWQWKEFEKDSVHGISLAKAKQILNQLPQIPTPIIVAILDGGIDTNHIDLKSRLWTNRFEIPENNIDDDHNGYIDDLHGWNFLGAKDGQNINKLSSEKTRIYHAHKALYEHQLIDTTILDKKSKKQYQNWLAAANEITFSEQEATNLQYVTMSRNVLKKILTTLYKELGDSNFNVATLAAYQPLGRSGLEAKMVYLNAINLLGIDKTMGAKDIMDDLNEYVESKENLAAEKEQAPTPIREQIIKDDYNNFLDSHYGNNDIMGPNSKHGTHVAGLASNQSNFIQIMGVRVVPDGDEYDKDIALGIRYAVDNGAKIINMSFGKSFSPEQAWVDSAIRYAASKDVLLIHSAGNEKYDLNTKQVYPSPYSDTFNDTANNIITVAASNDSSITQNLLADFSNYGNKVVDLMSPGNKIYSTLPNNSYGYLSGTSMAAPIVSYIAALLRAYYPILSAIEIKKILMQTCWSPNNADSQKALLVVCKTGGIVNAANAVLYAQEYIASPSFRKGKRKNKN